jgi:signal transduction histidine kinase
MIEKALQEKLDVVKSLLRNLENSHPPDEVRVGLSKIKRYFGDLEKELEDSQDQIRLAAIYRVSRVLGASLDLDEVLTQVMDAVISLTKAERGFLVMSEPGSNNWELRAARNLVQESLKSKDMQFSRTVIENVLAKGQGLVTTDAQSDPRFAGTNSVVLYALRSIMCSPLLSRGNLIGAIYVDNRAHTGIFDKHDLEMLNALAVQAAIAIENARLYTRTDRQLAQRIAELETLARIDQDLNSRLDLNHVLEITHQWVMNEAKAERCWILLEETKDGGEGLVTYPEVFPDVHDELVTKTLAEATTLVSAPNGSKPARLHVPLSHSGKTLGLVIVERPNHFSESEIRFLMHLIGRTAAALQNARLYAAVQQMSEAKSQFVSVVSHELRVPMTSIKGYSDLLRQGAVGPVNDQQVNFLNVIRNNVDRMSNLVSDLSDISKIEAGRTRLSFSFIPLKAHVEEIVRSLQPKLDEKGQRLELKIPKDLKQIYADPSRLDQILLNLLSNASKFTPQGGQLAVNARQEGDFIRVEVVDNGIGISPEDQKKLFSQFFRSEEPAVRNEPGWGLGLSIVRRLVELMGGVINVQSTFGKGSVFWFTLPSHAPLP